ncbi:hypothetical protein [Zhihengliuella halotolerans]|uniref:hypothetical protein n=1 Tax=Zhihengliuella halotolerans TaxID=370736 RepID=UPI0011AF98EC|nr:hypothetical protein [Zhihengliuella halotolerans]
MRTTAVLAAAVAGLHAWVLAAHAGAHGLWLSSALLVMTALCVKCAAGLWRARSRSSCRTELTVLLAMSAAMALTHTALVLGVPGLGGGHAGHLADAASVSPGAASSSSLMMLAVVPLELLVAASAASCLRRLTRAATEPTPAPDSSPHAAVTRGGAVSRRWPGLPARPSPALPGHRSRRP